MIQDNDVIIIAHKDAFNQDFEVEGFDFTGKTVKCDWRKDEQQLSPDLTFTNAPGDGITINQLNATQAVLTFSKTTPQMANVNVGTYQYDIEATDGAGNVTTICYGKVKVIKKYTY